MKIQLYTDLVTNKILGYNSIIPDYIDQDMIILEDEDEIKKLTAKNSISNLYYIDGKIVEKDNILYSSSYKDIQEQYNNINYEVQNENKTFMDNIINGMSLEDAINLVKENRTKLEELKIQLDEYDNEVKEKREQLILEKFNSEEELIDYKYFLSIIAIIRDENEYLVEWLNHHIELGVEHFYIYDNESEESPEEYLKSINYQYLDKITFIYWKTSEWSQQDAYNHWLDNYRNESKWVLASDPDEFVVIKDDSKTLKKYLEENSNITAIVCIWKHFNANGHETKTDEPVMERFTTSIDWDKEKNRGKVFAQTNRISRYSSHTPQVRLNSKILTYDSEISTDYFQLNHYITKSYEEWVEKIKRGTVHPRFKRNYQLFFELNPDMEYLNTGEDFMQSYGSANDLSVDEIENGDKNINDEADEVCSE